MITVKELQDFLAPFPPESSVAIDEGGLNLVSVDKPECYLEIGGQPVYTCGICHSDWPMASLIPLKNVPDLAERLDPGSMVPFGACPSCGGLCYPP